MLLPSINPRVNKVREFVSEKAVVVAYPESLDSIEQQMARLQQTSNPVMDSIARSVQEKFAQYKEESEVQRRRMFPHKDSPFKK